MSSHGGRARSESRSEPDEMSAEGSYEPFTAPDEARAIPWKLIAAGVVLIAATFAIMRGYAPSTAAPIIETAVRKVAPKAAPAEPPPAPPVAAQRRPADHHDPAGRRQGHRRRQARGRHAAHDRLGEAGPPHHHARRRQRRDREADGESRRRTDRHGRRAALLGLRRPVGALPDGSVGERQGAGHERRSDPAVAGQPHAAPGEQGPRLRRDRNGRDPARRGHAHRARPARPRQHQRRPVGRGLDRRREGRRDAAGQRRHPARHPGDRLQEPAVRRAQGHRHHHRQRARERSPSISTSSATK